jgi:uncharacterized RDD family membrane protein YckC
MPPQSLNPYEPPQSELEQAPGNLALIDAGKGRRFCTLAVDYAGFLIFSVFVGVVLGLVFRNGVQVILTFLPRYVFGAILISVYYVFFEGIWARTPGKFVCGTRVVAQSGEPPSMTAIMKRTLSRFIPFEAFTFFGDRGLHDRLSDTRVVLVER